MVKCADSSTMVQQFKARRKLPRAHAKVILTSAFRVVTLPSSGTSRRSSELHHHRALWSVITSYYESYHFLSV